MKKNGPGCCPCSGDIPFLHCYPCEVPGSTLTLSWYYWLAHFGTYSGTIYSSEGPLETSLFYVPPVGFRPFEKWDSGWVRTPDQTALCFVNPGNTALTGNCCWIRFIFTCDDTGSSLDISLASDSTGTPGNCSGPGTYHQISGSATYHCSPFMIEYAGDSFPGNVFAHGILSL